MHANLKTAKPSPARARGQPRYLGLRPKTPPLVGGSMYKKKYVQDLGLKF